MIWEQPQVLGAAETAAGGPQDAARPQPPQPAVQVAPGVPPPMVHPPVPGMRPGAPLPPNYPHQLPRPVVASQPVMAGPVPAYQQPQPQQLPPPQMPSGSVQMPVQAMRVAQRPMPPMAQMPMPGPPPMPVQSPPPAPMPAPPTEAGAPADGAEGKKPKPAYDGSTKPRRAQTAFNFFSAFARKNVRKVNPEISEDDLKSAVNQSWNELAAPTRAKFEEKEVALTLALTLAPALALSPALIPTLSLALALTLALTLALALALALTLAPTLALALSRTP